MKKLFAAISLALTVITNTAIAATIPNAQDWEFLYTRQVVPGGDVTFLAAAKGDAHSQYILGNSFGHSGAYPVNKKLEVYWTKKAYEQGHVGAAGKLGVIYGYGHSGYGVDRDRMRGIRMLEIAADAGIVSAQLNLGKLLDNTSVFINPDRESLEQIDANHKRAMYWYTKAADTDNGDDNNAAQAMVMLADKYKSGAYVEQDLHKAAVYYTRACAAGLSYVCNDASKLLEKGYKP